MKKALTILMAALLLVVPGVLAGINWTGPINGSGATAGNVSPIIEDWFLVFPYDYPSYNGRNSDWPEYEYAFTGEVLHLYAKVSDTTIYDVENMDVDAMLTWYDGVLSGAIQMDNDLTGVAVPVGTPGSAGYQSNVIDAVQMYMCSGTGATYDSATGRYWAQFCGDYIVQANRVGLGFWDVRATDPAMNVGTLDLATSVHPLYENVNNLLSNPTILLTANSGLSFTGVLVNQYNDADTYPIVVTLNTDDDEEGQGIIGDLFMAATNMIGATFPTDIIYAHNIRVKKDASGVWTNLQDNAYGTMPTAWTLIDTEVATDGVGYSEQFYFELWYAANHIDSQFIGGDLWLLYTIY
ncbi:hypothetical protein JW968_03305 [Candidatus Woesearchaeota archaeon]|nr:hypothetical protein [Candidatus Woesearchaeota archaeon]